MREAKDAASLTRPVTVRRLMPLVVPVELPVSATLSRRASVSVARDAASLTVTTAPMALEEEAMVADTSPVVATTAERPALAMHSREESAREVTDAVTVTVARVSHIIHFELSHFPPIYNMTLQPLASFSPRPETADVFTAP